MSFRSIIVGAILFIGLATITSSCKKSCSSVHCRSYGYNTTLGAYTAEVCNNGSCYCPNGLEGDSCQKSSLLKYFQPSANWYASDACSGFGSTYSVYMTYDQNLGLYNNVIYINGLFGGGAQVRAEIISNASHQGINLNIPSQLTPSGTINSGSGFYQSLGANTPGKITLNLDYTPNSTGIEINCTVLLSQQ